MPTPDDIINAIPVEITDLDDAAMKDLLTYFRVPPQDVRGMFLGEKNRAFRVERIHSQIIVLRNQPWETVVKKIKKHLEERLGIEPEPSLVGVTAAAKVTSPGYPGCSPNQPLKVEVVELNDKYHKFMDNLELNFKNLLLALSRP